ncbi:hypothetical protein V1504DRAFT_71230 [Lipomyces starkeyi]
MRRVNARPDSQITFTLTCSRSSEAKLERDPSRVQRYTVPKEVFDCQGELRITMSKVYESITMVYEHKCHMETDKFHMTEEVRNYIKFQKRLAPRQIYQNLIQMANDSEFEKTDLHTITKATSGIQLQNPSGKETPQTISDLASSSWLSRADSSLLRDSKNLESRRESPRQRS